MKDSAFLDLGVIHQAFSLREENPKDDTFRSVLCELSNYLLLNTISSTLLVLYNCLM